MSFWYNVDTGGVRTEAEARAALDTAHAKTEKWDAEDRAWNERGSTRSDGDVED